MKNLMTILALSMSLVGPSSFAAEGKCTCTDQCMTQCKNGDSKDCKCTSCDCAKSGKCSHDECHKDHKTTQQK